VCRPRLNGMASSSQPITVRKRARRSKRLALSVYVLVHGLAAGCSPFRELACATSLNANGALLILAAGVQTGQTLLVENKNTRQEQECRVVGVRPEQDGKWSVGVAFVHPAPGFWEIYFPPTVSR
jgi:hypothetical protein